MFRDLCVAFVSIYCFTHFVDYFESINDNQDNKQRVEVLSKKNKNNVVKKPSSDKEDRNNKDLTLDNTGLDDVVFIRPLGYSDKQDLQESANAVTNYFGIKTTILGAAPITESMFINDSLNGDEVLEQFKDNVTKTIYVSRYPLTDKNRNALGGLTYPRSKAIVINATSGIRHITIHEMCHTFGLRHCSNSECIMYYKYTKDADDLCSECKIKLRNNLK